MVQFKEKTVVSMSLAGASAGHARTDVKVRDVMVTIDEPLARGGTNLGPTPTEMVGASLLGCTTVIANRIAAQLRNELRPFCAVFKMLRAAGTRLDESWEVVRR